MQVSVTKDELYNMIKKAVKDVIREEKIDLLFKNTPNVSPEEMTDIVELYGKPKKRKAARTVALDI